MVFSHYVDADLHVLNLQPLFCAVSPPHPFTPPPMAVDQTSGSSCKERIFCFSTIVWDASISGWDANTSGQAVCVCVNVRLFVFVGLCTWEHMHAWQGVANSSGLTVSVIVCLLRGCWPSSKLRLLVHVLQEVVQKGSCECGGLNFLERLTFNFNLKSNFVCFY